MPRSRASASSAAPPPPPPPPPSSSQSLSLSRRADLHRWPAMGVLGRAAEAQLGEPLTAIEHVELYSCFPAAVRVQQAELGLDPDATATITGGMSFAGGPFNNFVFQATVAMVERLRERRCRKMWRNWCLRHWAPGTRRKKLRGLPRTPSRGLWGLALVTRLCTRGFRRWFPRIR